MLWQHIPLAPELTYGICILTRLCQLMSAHDHTCRLCSARQGKQGTCSLPPIWRVVVDLGKRFYELHTACKHTTRTRVLGTAIIFIGLVSTYANSKSQPCGFAASNHMGACCSTYTGLQHMLGSPQAGVHGAWAPSACATGAKHTSDVCDTGIPSIQNSLHHLCLLSCPQGNTHKSSRGR